MSTRNKVLALAAVATLGAGLLFAQGAFNRGERRQRLLNFVADYLDLTAAQRTQAKSVLEAERQEVQPIVEQLRQGHENMRAAIKAGKSDADLESIAAAQGKLVGELAGIHAKAVAKIYATLTPEQKAKADTLHDHVRDMIGRRFGAWR